MSVVVKEKRLPLIECFGPTIQGEGMVIGQQTYFLRLGLCDYKCTMCDSLHAVDPHSVKRIAQYLTATEIYNLLASIRWPHSTNWVTISGGNPCIHNLSDLIDIMHKNGLRISVETQGTFSPKWLHKVDALTISPKGPGMGEILDIKRLDTFVASNLGEVPLSMKVVVFDQRDIDFAAELADRYKEITENGDFYLSLGNPLPPDVVGNSSISSAEHNELLLNRYRTLFEDIALHPILSRVKFLPQWHVFVWGNGQGH